MSEKKIIQTLMIEDNPFFVVVFNDLGKKMKDIELNINHTISLEDSLNFLGQHREGGRRLAPCPSASCSFPS